MRELSFIILFTLSISCTENNLTATDNNLEEIVTSIEVPPVSVEKKLLAYNNKKSEWIYKGDLFSGYAVSFYEDSIPKQKFGIVNGRKQNELIEWYANGNIKHIANYHKGKLQGDSKTWSPDSAHILVSHLFYNNGKLDGVQKKWYSTGEPFKILNMNMGIEEGIQQAFRKNGTLFANYEAKDGRIFGLKKAALCFDLENENIKNEE